jgi:hypothetical protein
MQKETSFDPAVVIERLGGNEVVAHICQCTEQAVSQWKGVDANGNPRTIPNARVLHLRAIRPDVFVNANRSEGT